MILLKYNSSYIKDFITLVLIKVILFPLLDLNLNMFSFLPLVKLKKSSISFCFKKMILFIIITNNPFSFRLKSKAQTNDFHFQ